VEQPVVRQRTSSVYLNAFKQPLKIVAPNFRALLRNVKRNGQHDLLNLVWSFPSQAQALFFNVLPTSDREYTPVTPINCSTCKEAPSVATCERGSLCAGCQQITCTNSPRGRRHVHLPVNLLVLCACGLCETGVLPSLSAAIGTIKSNPTRAKQANLALPFWSRGRQLWQMIKDSLVRVPKRVTDSVRERAKQELQRQIGKILDCDKPSKSDRLKLALCRRRLRKVLWNCGESTSLPPPPASHRRRFTNVQPCACKSACSMRCRCRSAGRACGELCHLARSCRCTNMGEDGEHCWSSDDEGKEPTLGDLSRWIWAL